METAQEGKEEGKGCCGTKKCCGKALGALALLLIGGAGGYFAARHCKVCAVDAPAVSAPAQAK